MRRANGDGSRARQSAAGTMRATRRGEALAREPAWEAFVRGRLMREEDVARLTKIADVARSLNLRSETTNATAAHRDAARTMRATLEHHGDAVCETLLDTLRNVGAVEATEHVLALVDVVANPRAWSGGDAASDARDETFGAKLFVRYDSSNRSTPDDGLISIEGVGGSEDAYYVLSKTLARPEDANSSFIKETASRVLTRMLQIGLKRGRGGGAEGEGARKSAESAKHALRTLVSWCAKELRASASGGDESMVPAVASALAGVLDDKDARAFAASEGIVTALTPVLRASDRSGVQTMYEVALCFWLMSFSADLRIEMCARGAATVKALMACAGAASKEKVIRVCILALKNITNRHGAHGDAALDNFTAVDESLRKLVHNLSLRGFEDEELSSTLEELEEDLRARRKEASSWERYKNEVMSGSLEWSAAHKDEGFWRECATKLTDNNCQILRILIKLIDGSEEMDPKTLAVACHDIGEFAVHYPAGRFLANDLGGKEHSMRLMTHYDEEVRKSALKCVQKLLVASWRSLNTDANSAN